MRRSLRLLRSAPIWVQISAGLFVLLALAAGVNWMYQVIRKPTELFFPVSGVLSKTPAQTWAQYGPIFHEHATRVITADFLAALAQAESVGNPLARTYWRWRLAAEPFDVYRPASSAVGMYQITDGTFAEAKRYCIHDNAVVDDEPWDSFDSCWFNGLYLRLIPSHAVEMTSAYLDRHVADTLRRQRIVGATLQQKQDLAAVIHLCGAAAGEAYAKRRFTLVPGQRCGDHNVRGYLAHLNALKRMFARYDIIPVQHRQGGG